MSRKADPILLRTGLNRFWKVNLLNNNTPANYQYLMQRFDKSLNGINAMLIEFEICRIKSINRHILYASIFKYFPSKFQVRYGIAYYLASINELYYYLLWRRWYRIKTFKKSLTELIPNYLSFFFFSMFLR